MQITQKKLLHSRTFVFGEESLQMRVRKLASRQLFTVGYADLPWEENGELMEHDQWWLNAGLAAMALGLLQLSLGAKPFLLLPGLLCLVAWRLSRADYLYFETAAGRLLIMRDDQAPAILKEIAARRKHLIRSQHLEIDFNNSPHGEIAKYDWMLQHDLLDFREHRSILATIRDKLGDADAG